MVQLPALRTQIFRAKNIGNEGGNTSSRNKHAARRLPKYANECVTVHRRPTYIAAECAIIWSPIIPTVNYLRAPVIPLSRASFRNIRFNAYRREPQALRMEPTVRESF